MVVLTYFGKGKGSGRKSIVNVVQNFMVMIQTKRSAFMTRHNTTTMQTYKQNNNSQKGGSSGDKRKDKKAITGDEKE